MSASLRIACMGVALSVWAWRPAAGGPQASGAPGAATPDWMSSARVIERRKEPEAYRAFLDTYAQKYPPAGMFPKTMAGVALAEDQLPKVTDGHPRLMVRRAPWKYGLSLDELRDRTRRPPWAADLARLAREYRCEPGAKKKLRWYDGIEAARYHLLSGDTSIVPSLVDWILEVPHAGYGRGGWPFIVYDWIYNALPPEQRKRVEPHLVKLARGAIGLQEGTNCGDVWRHRGGGAVDPLVAGLALHGECPEGRDLLRMGVGYYRAAMLPARQHVDGAWLGGGHSYDGAEGSIPRALLCWASATDEDIFAVIRRDYGNWLESRMYFWMSQVYPDRTRPEVIGTDYCPWKLILNTDEFLITSRAYGNPDGYRFLRWLQTDPKSDILLYDERLEEKGPSAVFSAPWSKLWGRRGTGYVQARSRGWEPDSTVVEFRCGDYFESHGHYGNQNSFYLYHRGRLALHTGIYDSFAKSQHWHQYYRRTLASNSMLVFQPGEFRTGLDGFIPEPGGQWPDTFGYRNFTQKEYDWHLQHDGPWYDMGNITAFECATNFSYTYVCGDATAAYNNPRHLAYSQKDDVIVANRLKIDRFTRSLVYLPPGQVVIFDRVNAMDPSYRKAWLLHSIGKPEIAGRPLRAEVPDHIEDFDADSFTITFDSAAAIWNSPDTNAVGRLFVQALLPRERVIRRIGGDGYQFWANGQNWVPGYDVWKPNKKGKGQDAGNWRLEISPARPATFDHFLNLIHIGDDKAGRPMLAATVRDAGDKMVGLAAAGWLVLFGARGEVDGEVSYEAPKEPTDHLIVDLKRGAKYRASGIAGGELALTASPEGTLRFHTEATGRVKLTPLN